MLTLKRKKFHRVLKGQTLESIANSYQIPPRLLVKENGLKGEVWAGQILVLPFIKGNVYTAQAGDSKELLCGSKENYVRKNGTDLLYPAMKVWL